MCQCTWWLIALWLVGLASPTCAEEFGLTFFGWSDQHVQTDGNGDHLLPAVEAMNSLPGTAFPESVGGQVAEPAFVIGCGDVTEWPTRAAVDTYANRILPRLRWRTYDLMGNHDEGGKAPSDTMKQWIIKRHGALSYGFEAGGIQFLAIFSPYDESLNNPAQAIHKDALTWLRDQLARLPKNKPAIVATHLCYDAITNRDEFVDALQGANVLMVLGGHYHQARVDRYRDIDFVQLPSPAPKNSTHEVTVVRISRDRVVALPYDYRQRTWGAQPNKLLDKRLSKTDVKSTDYHFRSGALVAGNVSGGRVDTSPQN
jgi:hypothetical protein